MKRSNQVVSASEIASWTWCPESWRLEALGEEPENLDALARGDKFHAKTVTFETHSRSAVKVGRGLLVAAILLILLAIVMIRLS